MKYSYSDAPLDLKIKSHMICDLLNMISLPCIDSSAYLNKQKQINGLQSPLNKRVSCYYNCCKQSYVALFYSYCSCSYSSHPVTLKLELMFRLG